MKTCRESEPLCRGFGGTIGGGCSAFIGWRVTLEVGVDRRGYLWSLREPLVSGDGTSEMGLSLGGRPAGSGWRRPPACRPGSAKERGFPALNSLAPPVPPRPLFYMKWGLHYNFFGNQVYYRNSLILLAKNMLCSKLHYQQAFNIIVFSYKIFEGRGLRVEG